MTDQKMIIAAAIKDAVKRSSLTYGQVALAIGRSRTAFTKWVSGERIISAADIAAIAGATGQTGIILDAIVEAARLTQPAEQEEMPLSVPRAKLREARIAAGLSGVDAAALLGASRQYICAVESGAARLSAKKSAKIMQAYETIARMKKMD